MSPVRQPSSRVLTFRDKSTPPSAHGSTIAEFLATGSRLSAFLTPILTLDRRALDHNERVMRDWLAENGFLIAPHGKTTMAPVLWRELMDAGAWGITVATAWQAGVAREAGIRRIMIANTVVDPVGARWLAQTAARRAAPGQEDRADEPEILSWVDDPRAVGVLEDAAASVGATLPVIVELGAVGGRTGARGSDAARAVARAVSASAHLELAGVGGYEGAVAHDRSQAGIAGVDAYLDEVRRLHASVVGERLYRDGRPVVTVGGSAYLDRVAARLSGIVDADVVLRSGAYQLHDDGFYARIGPMGILTGTERFRSAMHLRARVVSRPERELAILDAGRRDLPFDEGLPVPQVVVGSGSPAQGSSIPPGSTAVQTLIENAEVTAVNDQHAFLRMPGASIQDLPVGTVIRLGLSHPCTAMDKWRLVPVVDDAFADDPLVLDLVETVF